MSKLFLSITFITTCLITGIATAEGFSEAKRAAGSSPKYRVQVDAVPPQANTNTDKHEPGFSEAKRAAGSANHEVPVDAAPQSNTNTDKHGSGFSEAKKAAGSGKY